MKDGSDLRDCYFSPYQWRVMQMLGYKMSVTLNGKQVSQIFPHGTAHELLKDEVFVGTAPLAEIDCDEKA